MTAYHPCKNCKLEKMPCPRRDGVKAAIKGFAVTTLKMRCDERQPIFSAGDRVSVVWRRYEEHDDCGNAQSTLFRFTGTVSQERYPKFLVRYDDADGISEHGEHAPARSHFRNESLYAATKPSDMVPLDEPRRNLCKDCVLGPCNRDLGYLDATPNCMENQVTKDQS
jgi:hypothetical protein